MGGQRPYFTIITPCYNRSTTIGRTIESVKRQDFRDFEYIIVDDGSQDDLDSIVMPFLNEADFPVMYIKKENGGVHTARNAAVKRARGRMLVNIDSDDELLSHALSAFYHAWESIPIEERGQYREVVARCCDEKGHEVGARFPKNINSMPWAKAIQACQDTHGEHVDCSVTKILVENQFPEVEGVTFMTENIVWVKLYQRYKSWFINDIVRVYHLDGEDHLSTDLGHRRKTIQSCRNAMFESSYVLNHWDIYNGTFSYPKEMLRYSIMSFILGRNHDQYHNRWKLDSMKDRFIHKLIALPSWVLSYVYEKKRM